MVFLLTFVCVISTMGTSRSVRLEPFQPSGIRQMLNLEVREHGLEPVPVWRGCNWSDPDWHVVLEPCVAHHRVLVVIEGIEKLHCVAAADCLYPYRLDGFVDSLRHE